MLEADPDPALWPLERLHVSGEPLSGDLVRRLDAKLPASCLVLNIYGSAEVTADATSLTLDQPARAAAASGAAGIGLPLPGVEILLLDERKRPVAPCAIGEIHVGGL